jgi:hypothetical protein
MTACSSSASGAGVKDAHYGSGLSFKDPDGLPLELFCAPAT